MPGQQFPRVSLSSLRFDVPALTVFGYLALMYRSSVLIKAIARLNSFGFIPGLRP